MSNNKKCSFCNKNQNEVKKMVASNDVYICNECIELCYSIIEPSITNFSLNELFGLKTQEKKLSSEMMKDGIRKNKQDLSTNEMLKYLNEYIIGQDGAKKIFVTAVYNHYKKNIIRNNNEKIEKKDEIIEVEKSNILMVGPTGSGKTAIIKALAKFLEVPYASVDATCITESGYVGDDVDIILKRLLESANNDVSFAESGIVYIDEIDKIAKKTSQFSNSRDISGEGVQQSLLKMMEGDKITIDLDEQKTFQISGMQKNTVTINTANILFIFGGAFSGIEEIIAKRLKKSSEIGFIAEKVAEGQNKINEFIHKVESEDLISFGMIPEFIGRTPIVISLSELSREELVKILIEPKNSITKQYKELFKLDNVELTFTDCGLNEIADIAYNKKIGARGLRSIVEKILTESMFLVGNKEHKILSININKNAVLNNSPIIEYKTETDVKKDDEKKKKPRKIRVAKS